MRDGIGSVVMITIIIVFIVAASSYLAFNVNYTKAFRMKNKIISIYEDYDGVCDPANCEKEIEAYARDLGYLPANLDCNDYEARPASGKTLYCVKRVTVDTASLNAADKVIKDKIGTHYFKIVTRINIEIPIFDNIFGSRFLYINGDTMIF